MTQQWKQQNSSIQKAKQMNNSRKKKTNSSRLLRRNHRLYETLVLLKKGQNLTPPPQKKRKSETHFRVSYQAIRTTLRNSKNVLGTPQMGNKDATYMGPSHPPTVPEWGSLISALVARKGFIEPISVRGAGPISSLFNALLYLHIHSVLSSDNLLRMALNRKKKKKKRQINLRSVRS